MLLLPPGEGGASPQGLAGVVQVLRAWLADPARDEVERAAFEEYARELTVLYFHWLGFGVAAAALVWWPTDWLVYADDPRVREVFARFRATIIALDVGLALTLPRILLLHRYAHQTAVAVCLVNVALAGWTLAELGQGDPLWLGYMYVLPLFSVLLPVSLGPRLAASSSFWLVGAGAWLVHPATALFGSSAVPVLSYFVFATLVSVGVGHAVFVLMRRGFHLRRRVERQRAALAELAERLEQRVAEQTRSIRDMHHRAQSLRAEQRIELARDLHDGLGQELTSLRLLVGLGQQLAAHGEADDVLGELDGQVARVQQSLRRVLEALRPQKLDELGLPEALRELTGELERRSGLTMPLTLGEDLPTPLPSDVSLALYRIAQEGLNNAIRHARARRVEVRLLGDARGLRLEIQDDGVGLPPGRVGAGLGTRGVVERVEALGGQARWSVDGGTLLSVHVPL